MEDLTVQTPDDTIEHTPWDEKKKGIEKDGLMLEVKNLMVFYENALAINNINLVARRREITGVFGANSAGKSM